MCDSDRMRVRAPVSFLSKTFVNTNKTATTKEQIKLPNFCHLNNTTTEKKIKNNIVPKLMRTSNLRNQVTTTIKKEDRRWITRLVFKHPRLPGHYSPSLCLAGYDRSIWVVLFGSTGGSSSQLFLARWGNRTAFPALKQFSQSTASYEVSEGPFVATICESISALTFTKHAFNRA